MRNSIGYHTRQYGDDSVKCVAGSFGGSLDLDTVARLLHAHKYTVAVKPTGYPVFVDAQGRPVRLYISVDPEATDIGREALRVWRAEKSLNDAERQRIEDALQAEIDEALSGLTHEEILARLRRGTK